MTPEINSSSSFRNKWRVTFFKFVISTLLFFAGILFVPYSIFSRNADDWFTGDITLQTNLARGVEKRISSDISRDSFSTGSKQFDGEWLFGTFTMAGMGFGQVALEHPELRTQYIAQMGKCIEKILSLRVREFDIETWGNDPIDSLGTRSDHAAYLGYLNLLISFHRFLNPASEYAALNDRITEHLVERINNSKILLLESYPYEVYPVDNCYVIASIGLHAKATGIDRRGLIDQWAKVCREKYIDSETGLLIQAVNSLTGSPIDEPRGSGTTLGLYALSFMDTKLSKELYDAAKEHLADKSFGFGCVREYPGSSSKGLGDIDSGPIVFGYGLSATGFMIAGARIHGDAEYFRRLYATAHGWGVPVSNKEGQSFITGGSLGNAILFAMLTARPAL